MDTNIRAGEACEICKTDYSDAHSWGLECPRCTSKLPNDRNFKIAVRICNRCVASQGREICPFCGRPLMDSIL